MSISKLGASFFSAVNENSAALAAVRFDFTLVKIDAPIEYLGLGSVLSSRRRTDAEDGAAHRTARKLGALFEQLVPSTPKLIAAYGTRSSEIIHAPGINPQGSSIHGPFQSFIGVDGTAMWAAATSSISALGVYLLACLLARAWDSVEATSIWVELVAGRRNEIEAEFKAHHCISESSLLSARQAIERKDLALWDLSARSWLRSADQANTTQKAQLMLILKNIKVPVGAGPSTYTEIIKVWQQSMRCLEKLLSGMPQEISDGSLLLALSAWHFFPDLIVLGSEVKNVKFNDRLIPSNGVVTVGLQSCTSSKEGIQWSLALSHLEYYGGPVMAQNSECSRLSFQELQLVILGAISGAWDMKGTHTLTVAQWFQSLWSLFKRSPWENVEPTIFHGFQWLHDLADAAERLLRAKEDSTNLMLIKWGQRRAKLFLGNDLQLQDPFFRSLQSLLIG